MCCAYGVAGMANMGFDCVVIPGASNFLNKLPVPNSICGQGKGLVTAIGGDSKTVCSK